MSDPYAAFERDVPQHLQEDAMQMMAEATGGYGEHESICILERDQIDAINARAHGIITIEGVEYVFQMEDGNRNGTELLSWNEGKPFERHVPTAWALQPIAELVGDALEAGKGPFLIFKWDAMLKNRPALAAIPGKYAYDRFVQPGGLIEGHYRAEAAAAQFEIVPQEVVDETRAKLARSSA